MGRKFKPSKAKAREFAEKMVPMMYEFPTKEISAQRFLIHLCAPITSMTNTA